VEFSEKSVNRKVIVLISEENIKTQINMSKVIGKVKLCHTDLRYFKVLQGIAGYRKEDAFRYESNRLKIL